MAGSLETFPTSTASAIEHPTWLGGEPVRRAQPLEVINPCDGRSIGRTFLGSDSEFERAAELAVAAAPAMRALPAYEQTVPGSAGRLVSSRRIWNARSADSRRSK